MTDGNQSETDRVTRRRTLEGIGGGVGLAALGAFGSVPAAADRGNNSNGRWNQPWRHGMPQDWTQVYYDPSNRSRTPTEGPTDEVTVKWQKEVGHTMDWQPAVRDGTVYVGGRGVEFEALDADTGEEIWKREWSHGAIAGAPALYKDTVIFPNSHEGYNLWALDAETGDTRWLQDKGGFMKSPKIYDGIIYQPRPGALDAIDADTGDQLWLGWVKGPMLDAPAYHPNGPNGTVYATSYDYASGESISAFDAKTGEVRWRGELFFPDEGYSTGTGSDTAPVVYDGVVYVFGTSNGINAFDQDTGEELWRRKTTPDHMDRRGGTEQLTRPPAVKDGVLYYGTYSRHRTMFGGHKYYEENSVWAMDIESGEFLWRNHTGHVNHGGPVIASETVYVISYDTVYAIDIANGDTRWTFEMSTKGYAGPAVVNGTVYAGDLNGNLYALAED